MMPKIKSKKNSIFMKTIAFLIYPFNRRFMTNYWTTIFGTIYAPVSVDVSSPQDLKKHKNIIEHEKVHLNDQKNHPILFPLSYVFPPIFLAYGRWRWERKAYLVSLSFYDNDKEKKMAIERIVDKLGGSEYFWTWPKSWIKKWFYKKLNLK